eukprot:Filipodium_phascolosomae@DN8307_c0_g1_i1.p1
MHEPSVGPHPMAGPMASMPPPPIPPPMSLPNQMQPDISTQGFVLVPAPLRPPMVPPMFPPFSRPPNMRGFGPEVQTQGHIPNVAMLQGMGPMMGMGNGSETSGPVKQFHRRYDRSFQTTIPAVVTVHDDVYTYVRTTTDPPKLQQSETSAMAMNFAQEPMNFAQEPMNFAQEP